MGRVRAACKATNGVEPVPVELLPCQKSISFELYLKPKYCREYLRNGKILFVDVAFDLPPAASEVCPRDQDVELDNGITIGKPKIYDAFALRKLLASTATQLATITPFGLGSRLRTRHASALRELPSQAKRRGQQPDRPWQQEAHRIPKQP
jgi:hypothetical protein